MVHIKTKKVWQEAHDRINPHPEKMDGVAETKAMDAFLDERDKQLAFSQKDREWEKERKKEWAGNKKYWLKDQEEKNRPKNLLKELIDDVKNGGKYETNVHPLQGYILTKLEKPEVKTSSGIVLPDMMKEETPNTARVVEVGPGYWIFNDHFQEATVKPGQMVIFRKLAGMEVDVKGEKFHMLHFSDMIATVDD